MADYLRLSGPSGVVASGRYRRRSARTARGPDGWVGEREAGGKKKKKTLEYEGE